VATQLAEAYVELSQRGFSGVAGAISGIAGKLTDLTGIDFSFSNMISLAAEAETTATSFEVLLGSAGQAQAMLGELNDFAASTPFQFAEIAKSAKQLIAFGEQAGNVTGVLTSLGDVSAGLNIPLGELTEIYGKARTQGRLFMEDINQLAGRGIPIHQELAKQFGVTGEEVRELVSSGQVNFGHLQQAMQDLTGEGGQFAGLMERQSQTLAGQWSTMKDNITIVLRDIGTAMSETFDFKAIVGNVTSFAKRFGDGLSIVLEYVKFTTDNWGLLWEIAIEKTGLFLSNAVVRVQTFGTNIVEVVQWAMENWRDIIATSVNAGITFFTNLAKNLRDLWSAAMDFISGKGFNFDPTPIMEGFESSIKEMPSLTEAAVAETTDRLDRLQGELNDRAVEQGFGMPKGPAEALAKSNEEQAAKQEEQKKDDEKKQEKKPERGSSQTMGIADLAGQIQKASLDRAEKIQKETADNTRQIADQLASGIKVKGSPAVAG